MKPYKNKLYIKKEVIDDVITTSSGIFVIDGKAKREKIDRGVVLAVADNLHSIYSPGDIVIYPKYGIGDQDQNGFFLNHDSVLGKMS